MSKPKFRMGQEVLHEPTGFNGRITGICDYATGCRHYLVQPRCGEDTTKMPEACWLDEAHLIEKRKDKGGPQPYPPPVR